MIKARTNCPLLFPLAAVSDDGLVFKETSSGLKYADVKEGKGEVSVCPDSRVTVDLVGRLVGRQGWKFASTRDDDEPYRTLFCRNNQIAHIQHINMRT